MVVEDDFLVAQFISKVLADSGCQVVGPVAKVEQGLRLVEEEAVDGAVLDVNLGNEERSFPVAVALAKRRIPFVFLTGYGEGSVLPEEFREVRRLPKPFELGELVAVVRKLRRRIS